MNSILKYNGYFATIHFSAEDRVFYGKVSAINDLVIFEGSSLQELECAFKEAIGDYIETSQQIGESVKGS